MDDCHSENRLNYTRDEYGELQADKKRQAENLEGEIGRIAEQKNDLTFENAQLLALLVSISSFMKHLEQSEYAETAMEFQASIERVLEGE